MLAARSETFIATTTWMESPLTAAAAADATAADATAAGRRLSVWLVCGLFSLAWPAATGSATKRTGGQMSCRLP